MSTILVLLVIDFFAHSVQEIDGDEHQEIKISYDQNTDIGALTQEKQTAILGMKIIELEIADTEESRTLGLSGREKLEEDTGLLFVFEKPGYWGFWMKDMNFPIDIIWLDQNFRIISIKSNVIPESYPEIFYPDALTSYVLEVNAGVVVKEGIKVNDTIVVEI